VTSSTTVNVANDHTLYAKWIVKQYTVSFESNGGGTVSPKTVTYGSTYGNLTASSRN
jgi:hypothetical protein